MRAGIFAKTFERATLDAALDAVVAAGLTDIQFNLALLGGESLPDTITTETAARVRDATSARGLSMAAISGTYNMAHPDPHTRQRGRRKLATLLARARGLGTTTVTVCTGTRDPTDMWRAHPDNATPAAWSDMLASMAAAVETAQQHGVILGVEPEHGNVVRDAPAARRLLDELESPHVRIVIDPANLIESDRPQAGVLEEAFTLLGDDLVLAHAKDRRADGTVVAAGKGNLDYARYVDLLERARYTGPLVLHGLAEREVPAAVAFIRAQLRE